jgi:hypothetical protein
VNTAHDYPAVGTFLTATSAYDTTGTAGHVADQLEDVGRMLELLMIGARDREDGLAWIAFNDAAQSVQRAIATLVASEHSRHLQRPVR